MVDVNKPVENPNLIALMQEFDRNRTNENTNALLDEIALNAHFLSVIVLSEEPEANVNGTKTFKAGSTIQFPMLTSQDNQTYYPVFTDWMELGKWQGVTSPKTLILTFDDYASMVLQNQDSQGLVINPFGENMRLDRRTIEYVKTRKDINTKGVSQQTVEKETQVQLGEPKDYPEKMVQAISKHLRQHKQVRRVWLRLMKKDGEYSYLLVVDFEGDRREVFSGIADAARPYLDGMYVDMVSLEQDFGKNAVQNVTPFYQR